MPRMVGAVKYPAKPPKYWFESKRQLGMSDAAIGRIWFNIYKDDKRIAAWLAAPEAEWAEHGLKSPVRS